MMPNMMPMPFQAEEHAYAVLEARARTQHIHPLSSQFELSIEHAYEIAKASDAIRIAEGEVRIGRKLGFTNRKLWSKYGVKVAIQEPIWTSLFDSTVRYVEENYVYQSLAGALQPRIEPEVVFKLGKTPAADATIEELADCLEWMAHSIEIVVSPFPDWKFEAADAIAALGLHGTLLIGEPRILSSASRQHLAEVLANASVSISCDGSLRSAGYGSNVLDSPLHAIWYLHSLLQKQPQFPPLQAGEIITTGTWTDAYPVESGQTWGTAFSGVPLPGLSVSFA